MSDTILGSAGAGVQGSPPGSAAPAATGSPAPAAAAPATPSGGAPTYEPWRSSLPAELRGEKSLDPIKGKDWAEAGPALVKSFINAQRMVGMDRIAIPGANATPEDMNAFYSKLGRPETSDGYEMKLPQGLEQSQIDMKLMNDWRGELFKLGVPKAAGEALIGRFLAEQQQQANDIVEAQKLQAGKWINDLRQELGASFDEKANMARHAVNTLGNPELVKVLEETGLGNHPTVVKFFAALGQKMSDDISRGSPTIPHNPLGSPEAAQAALQGFQRDAGKMKALFDKNHPEHDNVVKERGALFSAAYPQGQ